MKKNVFLEKAEPLKRLIVFISLCLLAENIFSQVLGTPITSWDFANGIPSGWTTGSTSGIGQWEYRGPNTIPDNNIGSRGSCSAGTVALQSPSSSNGFMIFDSNFWDDPSTTCGNIGSGPDPGPHSAWMITNSIDLSSVSEVYITFNQQLRNYVGTMYVQISTNGGGTWQEISSLTQSNGYTGPNSEWKSAYITDLAAGQSNVQFKFLFDGFYYSWSIDDISLYSPSANNIAISNAQFTAYDPSVNFVSNMMYDQYPLNFLPTAVPNCAISNLGTNSQNNIVLQNKILKNGVPIYDQSISQNTLGFGQNTTLTNASDIINDGVGNYEVTFEISQAETDEDLTNNFDTLDFDITPYTYARDEGPADNLYNANSIYPNTTTTEIGNIYCFSYGNGKRIANIQVGIAEGTLPGTVIQGHIYIPTMDSILASTETYTVNLADINGLGEEKMITLPLINPVYTNQATLNYPDDTNPETGDAEINPFDGCVAAMVRNISLGQPFYVARSGAAPENTTYLNFPDESDLYYLLRIPQVRVQTFNQNQIPGCTIDSAMNYNPLANVDDGSCDFPGCTQEQYDNYSSVWNWDDGSCVYIGCLDPLADNYNPLATQIVPCIFLGCTNPIAINFDPTANTPDSSCIILGCTDVIADNFNPDANQEDSTCIYLGCTDTTAFNFSNIANQDDGTCVYEGCTDSLAQNFDPIASIPDGSCLYPGCIDPNADNFDSNANISDSSCFYLGCTDSTAVNFDPTATVNDGSCQIEGCTDTLAGNYNSSATIDDGSCFYLGCTDTVAANYDSTATVNDGSCIYLGCTDTIANNFSSLANQDDGSCLYYGCTDVAAINFDPTTNFNDGSCMYLEASLFVATTEGCDPLTINVINQTVAYPESVCEFIFSSGDTIYNCGSSFNYTFSEPGNFSITYNYYFDGFPSSAQLNNIIVNATPLTPIITENNGVLSCANCTGGVNYQWTLNNANIQNANNTSFNNLQTGQFLSGDFQLTASSDQGCSSSSNTEFVVQPFFSLLSNTICQNESAQANINSINLSGISCSINWGDGSLESVITPVALDHSYLIPGSYDIELVCFNNLDTGQYISNILVNEIPLIPILDYDSGIITINNPEANINYQWENNHLNILNEQDLSIDIWNGASYSNGWYNVIASNGVGCLVQSDSIFVAEPYFQISVDSICPNINIGFTDYTDQEPGMNCLIHWGDGTSNYDVNHAYSMSGQYIILMECSGFGQSYALEDSIYVFVAPAAPSLIYTIPNLEISNFENQNTYQWYLNQDLLFDQNSPVINISSNGAFNNGWYMAAATNPDNCTTLSDSLPILQPSFVIADIHVCPGDSTTLQNTTQFWENTCEIIWGDGYSEVISNEFNYHIFADSGTYEIELFCQNMFTSGTYFVTIATDPIPDVPVITYTFGQLDCQNFNILQQYQWLYNNTPLPNENNSQLYTLFNGSYQNGWYSLSTTNIEGCTQHSDSLPILQPYFNIIDPTVCPGDTTWLLDETSHWLSNCNINWGDGTSETLMSVNHYHVFGDTLNYNIELSCTNPYTQGSFSLEIEMNPIPEKPLVHYEIGEVQCDNYNGMNTYQWYLENTPISSSNGATHYNFNGFNYDNGWYQISSTNNFNCTVFSDSIFVIQPLFILMNDASCSADSILLENITQNYNDFNCSMLWGDGSNQTANTNLLTHLYGQESQYSLSMICYNEYSTGYFTDSILIIQSPIIPEITYTFPEVICTNCSNSLSFDWNLYNNDIVDAVNYHWNIWNGNNYSNGVYQLNVMAQNGCTSSSDSLWIIQPYFEIENDSICQFDTITLHNLTDGLDWMGCQINWGDGTNDNWVSNPTEHIYGTEGNQQISMVCTSNTTSTQGTMNIAVTIHPTPQPVLSEANNIVSCNNGISQWITQWSIDNTDQPLFDNTLSLSADLGIQYQMIAITEFGCQGQATITTDYIAPGLLELESNVLIFPNPVQDYLIIENTHLPARILIYDANSKLLSSLVNDQPNQRIELSNWSNGLYTIVIQNNTVTKTAQFLIGR